MMFDVEEVIAEDDVNELVRFMSCPGWFHEPAIFHAAARRVDKVSRFNNHHIETSITFSDTPKYSCKVDGVSLNLNVHTNINCFLLSLGQRVALRTIEMGVVK